MPKKEIIKEVIHGTAHVRIGKSGISERVINEIKRQLDDREVIKVKVLRSYLRVSGKKTKEIAKEVAEKVNAIIADVRGHTFVLIRKRK